MRTRVLLATVASLLSGSSPLPAQQSDARPGRLEAAIAGTGTHATAEISTAELRAALDSGSIVLLDTRPHLEWAISHIPGALNVAPRPGMALSAYTSDVAEIGRLVDEDRAAALVLYCNGPFCGKSGRVSADLLAAGYTNVRRYQLGAPVWRAAGGVMVIEPDGAAYVHAGDRTAVWIDAREAADFARSTVSGARNIPRSLVRPEKDTGEVRAAKDDGRLPMEDHNTRIVVFGATPADARYVAEAIAREAFHNVAYFEGDPAALIAQLGAH